ncbi:hypothetical protein ARMSODRAFT_981269 [Armillaria solidipes]|uniref:Uncharacterized protein n=1 Tax=Armillaria solidipes TaxID=1076256 RepID=A0A2H3AVX5_9AGAR|nr:hypothetical protein ARMSODRAFT_981269 [Armillaria solidipes]
MARTQRLGHDSTYRPSFLSSYYSSRADAFAQFLKYHRDVLPDGSYHINLGNSDAPGSSVGSVGMVQFLRDHVHHFRSSPFRYGSTVGTSTAGESIGLIAECLNRAHAATASVVTVLENMVIGLQLRYIGLELFRHILTDPTPPNRCVGALEIGNDLDRPAAHLLPGNHQISSWKHDIQPAKRILIRMICWEGAEQRKGGPPDQGLPQDSLVLSLMYLSLRAHDNSLRLSKLVYKRINNDKIQDIVSAETRLI